MFLGHPALAVMPKPDYWRLVRAITWISKTLRMRLPRGWVTDLGSVPRLLRNLPWFDVCGVSRVPCLIHDALYNCQETSRAFADEQLRLALVACGMTRFNARLWWWGVRIGGYFVWRRRLRLGGGLQADDFASPELLAAFKASRMNFVQRITET
jgi:hypothetical protein